MYVPSRKIQRIATAGEREVVFSDSGNMTFLASFDMYFIVVDLCCQYQINFDDCFAIGSVRATSL